ncbi:glycosyltransferase family protein [Neokomagataea anthophila]|uniref:Glycosyltransferase family 2 protein n=1 Tax=Neokomagataea anthophila TaxID=2826925 RepID=A0ABS5E673_9PROT|nr:glycosyltransferase family 2 protein [Neokomagataea anthophila]MBR0559407.1 glycosyltransferase family 2 protein [Neokomagataea anthophila]
MTDFFVVQDLLLPGMDFSAPVELYARGNDHVSFRLAERKAVFQPGGRAFFDTYYNGISVGAWKRMTTIDNVSVLLKGHGNFILRAGIHRLGQAFRWLTEQEIELADDQDTIAELPWAELDDGLLKIQLEAVSDGELSGGCFVTSSTPQRDVKLGVVITHFNRQSFVVPAIRRIHQELLQRQDYAGKIDLIVVDNSSNLTAEQTEGAIHIPNLNLGGSGGFTRGLLHLVDCKDYTHCLFMDDDASCEIESIRRAFTLQQFARDPKLAISGALLREMEPYRLFEKGASYEQGLVRPLNTGRDMRDVGELLLAERQEHYSAYGAWWFFCFDLKQFRHYPYPFFVRGDDALFGLLNDFKVETMNGISCWGEDFQLKENPLTRYLGLRSTLAIMLMTSDMPKQRVFRIMLSWFLSSILSYNYSSAQAIIQAVRDVSKGPEFWLENMDMSEIRAEFGPLNAEEKLTKVCLADYALVHGGVHECRLRRYIRLLSLNGFLLPAALIRKTTMLDHKAFRGTFRKIFRHSKVMYFYEAMDLGYVAEYDKKRFFKLSALFLKTSLRFLKDMPRLRRDYQSGMSDMTTEKFWRKIYSL